MLFFKSLRQNLIKEGSLKKYVLYAIGETLLIVIGILIALQVNNANQNIIKRDTELSIYQATHDQLLNYKTIIDDDRNFNKRFMAQFEYAVQIIEDGDQTKVDTLGKIASMLINYSDFDGQGNIYENLVNSGEINLLKNAEIVGRLRRLEEKLLHVNRIENIHYDAVMNYVFPGKKY